MSLATRFGKKIAIPSTAQIKHELRLMNAADVVAAAAGLPLTLAEVAVMASTRLPQVERARGRS